jgi:hypothetical protein
MPELQFGEIFSTGYSKFTKLKSKGDKIQFRIVKAPFYDGKHFLKDEQGNWNIVPCPRINEGKECEICNNYFKVLAKAKKDAVDQKEKDRLTKPFKPTISFYFPIINRETGLFEVFQTTKSVRDKIEDQIQLGVKILDRDIIVIRTEKPGADYYSLSVVDSAETKALSSSEQQELAKGKDIDLSEFIYGTEEEDTSIAVETNIEDEDEEDVPF